MPVGAVIFDWDGVVIDSSSLHERSWEALASEIGKTLPADHFKRGFGKRNAVIIPEILGWTQDSAEIDRWGKRKEELYRIMGKEEGIPILDGTRDFLRSLRAAGIPCVIGTSTERMNVELAFEQLDLASFFLGAVCSEDVSRGKPDPEVFLKAANLAGVDPQNCIVLEDSAHGIIAAIKGGMKGLGLATTRDKKDLIEVGADIVINNPSELSIGLLESLFQS
ncbi:MAG: HAD family phosphatase [Opitutae bacterium]|jgi:HAD superfamily hydrolase (TIGR01509 family)|nr:HAD family phosphatase [Opitutae bacterium]